MAGPFRGLSVLTNNVHALNSDALTNVGASAALFRTDPEMYLAVALQAAPSSRYRWRPDGGERPSAFLARVDPTPGAPGVSDVVTLPTHPDGSLVAPNSVWSSVAGRTVWEDVNAMSAWQNTLLAPVGPGDVSKRGLGRIVFERAGCAECHAGPYLTNHRVLPVAAIGTDGTRARALARNAAILPPPVAFAFDLPVPLPAEARTLEVPLASVDRAQVALAFAGDGVGGYKVPSLVGLAWTAPYLHDGSIAAGTAATDLGLPGTLGKNVLPDPRASLRALVDRALRARVIAANDADDDLRRLGIRGTGHERWVDAPAGFGADEQDTLLDYLMTFQPPEQTSPGT
jgi:hypothetical protein